MRRLKNIRNDFSVPWGLLVRETGFEVEGESFHDLARNVVAHLEANGHPANPVDIEARIHDYMAAKLPESLSYEVTPP